MRMETFGGDTAKRRPTEYERLMQQPAVGYLKLEAGKLWNFVANDQGGQWVETADSSEPIADIDGKKQQMTIEEAFASHLLDIDLISGKPYIKYRATPAEIENRRYNIKEESGDDYDDERQIDDLIKPRLSDLYAEKYIDKFAGIDRLIPKLSEPLNTPEVLRPLARLVLELKDRLPMYDTLISDEASGRLVTLLIRKVIENRLTEIKKRIERTRNHIATLGDSPDDLEDKEYFEKQIYFLETKLGTGELPETYFLAMGRAADGIVPDVQGFLEKKKAEGGIQRPLVVSEYVSTGETTSRWSKIFSKIGLHPDWAVAKVEVSQRHDIMKSYAERLNDSPLDHSFLNRLYYGYNGLIRKGVSSLFHQKSGVDKVSMFASEGIKAPPDLYHDNSGETVDAKKYRRAFPIRLDDPESREQMLKDRTGIEIIA